MKFGLFCFCLRLLTWMNWACHSASLNAVAKDSFPTNRILHMLLIETEVEGVHVQWRDI